MNTSYVTAGPKPFVAFGELFVADFRPQGENWQQTKE
jgi:hypothetical protein